VVVLTDDGECVMGISYGEDAAIGVYERYAESHDQEDQDVVPAVIR